MTSIAPYLKAVTAALVAGLASLQQALDGDNSVTASEWVSVAVATLVALGAVWAVPWKPAEPPAPEGGQVDVVLLLVVATFLGVVLLLFGVKFN